MFRKLLDFEFFYQLKQKAFPLFVLLFFVLGIFIGKQGFAPKGVNFNAVYQVYFHTGIFTLGSVFIIMFFAISAMLRDKQYHMEGLIYSSSIKKRYYFWSRFLGTFLFSALAFSPFMLGYIVGNYFFDLDPERIGDFQILTYLQPWLYMILPNIFICSAVIFSVSTITKNSVATYASAVFVYMLYFVCSMFLNSPLLAQSVPASPEAMRLAAVLDPFGIATFFEQTQYWTPYQKNTQLLSFSGLFLLNRFVWIASSLIFLLITYKIFSFRKITKKVKKEKIQQISNVQQTAYNPLKTVHNFKAQQLAFFSLLKLELKNVFKSLPFLAVLLMWLFIIFSELYSTITSGGEYNVSLYPYTNELIELIVDPLTIFSLILIVFYSSEIIWKERNLNFNLIIDATPIKNSVFFLSKFFAILLLPIILIATGILMCIAFQISFGYTNFELGVYMSLFYYYGLQLAIFCMIILFINSIAKSKYLGMGISGLLVILSFKANLLGLEHPLTSIGFMPRAAYTNMNGVYGVKMFHHLAIYWGTLGSLLVVLSFKLWHRGSNTSFLSKINEFKYNWTKVQKVISLVLLVLFVGSASFIYRNTNIISDYVTVEDRLSFRENYERKFKHYESLERLYPVSIKTEVAIYPENQKYTVKAYYLLKNKSDKPLKEVFITERMPLQDITIENASLVNHDTNYGTYNFKLKTPLKPNHSIKYSYEISKSLNVYEEDNSILKNGTYIMHQSFEPVLGYNANLEISDKIEREKRNLPKRKEEDNSDTHIEFEDYKNEKIPFEVILSTTKNQTGISSGRLLKTWTKDDRNYYHYKTKGEVIPMVAYFSAKYKTKKVNYKGISIEQFFDENHDFNIKDIEESTKQTLDYCQANFGKYNFDYVRIAEVPSHWSFGGFAHPGVISMVEDRLYLCDIRDEDTFNLVAKRTIHEVAHQWWGHTLSSKPVPGGSLFTEGFAKYTEAVILEKLYGKTAVYELVENARSRYFRGRAYAGDLEPPVYKVFGQGYISYGKALTVMLALKDLIGEEKVNEVIKELTDKHRETNTLEVTSIEFLKCVYKKTPTKYHNLVDDWFKRVITYDLGIESGDYKKLNDGTYEVSVKIKANRFETKNNGEIKEISLNEPIRLGVFTKHPSEVKNKSSILHYKLTQIKKGETEIKIIVKEKPKYIAIDPYGTRSDENLVDNMVRL